MHLKVAAMSRTTSSTPQTASHHNKQAQPQAASATIRLTDFSIETIINGDHKSSPLTRSGRIGIQRKSAKQSDNITAPANHLLKFDHQPYPSVGGDSVLFGDTISRGTKPNDGEKMIDFALKEEFPFNHSKLQQRPHFLAPQETAKELAESNSPQTIKQVKKFRPKNFQCSVCQIGFSNNGQLKNHVRIHTGERPFQCTYPACQKTFTRNEELTRHKLIHTGIRPHVCTCCGKSFGRKDHLKKHVKTHDERRKRIRRKLMNKIRAAAVVEQRQQQQCQQTTTTSPMIDDDKSVAISRCSAGRGRKRTAHRQQTTAMQIPPPPQPVKPSITLCCQQQQQSTPSSTSLMPAQQQQHHHRNPSANVTIEQYQQPGWPVVCPTTVFQAGNYRPYSATQSFASIAMARSTAATGGGTAPPPLAPDHWQNWLGRMWQLQMEAAKCMQFISLC